MTDDEIHAEVQKAVNALSKLRAHVAGRSGEWSDSGYKGYAFAMANSAANRAWSSLHDFWGELLNMQREFSGKN